MSKAQIQKSKPKGPLNVGAWSLRAPNLQVHNILSYGLKEFIHSPNPILEVGWGNMTILVQLVTACGSVHTSNKSKTKRNASSDLISLAKTASTNQGVHAVHLGVQTDQSNHLPLTRDTVSIKSRLLKMGSLTLFFKLKSK